jgi:hypothetical protein
MPQLQQWYGVLWSKLKPSVDIQRMGSNEIPLKGSTLFGPQIRTTNIQAFQHKQNPHIAKQLSNMNK